MSGTRESQLWRWLSKVKPWFRYDLHMCRVENSAMAGMLDVEGCLRGMQFWIELKCVAEPKPKFEEMATRMKIDPGFRPKQVPWAQRRVRAGGHTSALIQVGMGRSARRYLIRGSDLAEIEQGTTECTLRRLCIVPPNSDASTIIEAAASH